VAHARYREAGAELRIRGEQLFSISSTPLPDQVVIEPGAEVMWTCAECGERLDLAFDQCRRCANQRQLTPEEDAAAAAQDAFEEGLEAEALPAILSPEALAATTTLARPG
jgi:hypothetical protein